MSVQSLTPAEREQAIARAEAEILLRQRRGTWGGGVRAHTEYQHKSLEWIVEKLGIPAHSS